MVYARTQLGAKKRVIMKRALRKKGISFKDSINTKNLEKLYSAMYGKTALRKVRKLKIKKNRGGSSDKQLVDNLVKKYGFTKSQAKEHVRFYFPKR